MNTSQPGRICDGSNWVWRPSFSKASCIAQESLSTEKRLLMTKVVTEPLKGNGMRPANTESVADILEHELNTTIQDWMALVEKQEDLMSIPLSYEDRTGHLPALLHEVISRLRLDAGSKAPISVAASHHGDLRQKQGYSVAMVVEESRLLQVSLFTTLHKHTNRIEYSKLLPDVVTIADEVDAQLKQQMLRYMNAGAVGPTPKIN
jgi:hypothetical protein